MAKTNSNPSLQQPKSRMSLLALLFFMMGSVDLYGRIQASHDTENGFDAIPSFLKFAALSAIAAGALELGHLTHLVG